MPACENLELALVHSTGREKRWVALKRKGGICRSPPIRKLLAEALESVFVPSTKRLPIRRAEARVDRFVAFYYLVPLMAGIANTYRANRQARLQGMSLFGETGEMEPRVRMRIDFGHDEVLREMLLESWHQLERWWC